MSEQTNAPKEHWKAREAREKREAEAQAAAATPTTTAVKEPEKKEYAFNKKKPSRFIKAFEQEFYFYVLTRVNRKPSYTNSRQPFFCTRYSHSGIDYVIHPETKRPCTIRYIQGETSIFKDEQSSQVTDKNCTPIIFEDGLCKVGHMETNLRQFLDLCNANQNAKNRDPKKMVMFHLYDSTKKAEESNNREMELARALVYFDSKTATDEGLEQIMAYAKTLGLDMNRRLSEIKADMTTFLKRDPKAFLEGLDSKRMKRKYIVMEALDMGVLIKDHNSGTISWPSGQGLCTPPIGKDPVDYFVDWSFDKGQETYDHIHEETEKILLERA